MPISESSEGANYAYDELSIAWECRSTRLICVADDTENMKRHPSEWCPTSFTIRKALYKGKASLLYVATDLVTSKDVVLKLYRKSKLSTLNRYQVEREIRIHIRLKHNFIVALYAAFEDAKYVYMVQEYAEGGDLFGYLKKNGGQFRERRAVHDVIQPFLNVLRYLHALGIIHRDIKPENILVTRDMKIRVADFGLSIDIKKERPVTRAGTLDYMAPEVLVCPDKKHPDENKDNLSLAYSKQVDIWAVGVLAYEMIVGYPPFEKESRSATYDEIMHGDPSFPSWMTDGCQDFIKQALTKNSAERPDIIDLMKHPWIAIHKRRNSYHASKLEVSLAASQLLRDDDDDDGDNDSRDSDCVEDKGRTENRKSIQKAADRIETPPNEERFDKDAKETGVVVSLSSYNFKHSVCTSQEADPEKGDRPRSVDNGHGVEKSASKKCQNYVTPPTGILSETTVVFLGTDQRAATLTERKGSSKSLSKISSQSKQGQASEVIERLSSLSEQSNPLAQVDRHVDQHSAEGNSDSVSLPASTLSNTSWRQASSPLNPSRSKDAPQGDLTAPGEGTIRPKEKGLGSQVMEALGFVRPASPAGDVPPISRVASLRPIKLFSSFRERAMRSNTVETKEACDADSDWEVASRESSTTPFPPAAPPANLRPAHRLDREISGSQLSFTGKQCGSFVGSPRIQAEYGTMHKSSSLSSLSIDCTKTPLVPIAAKAYESCGGLRGTTMEQLQ